MDGPRRELKNKSVAEQLLDVHTLDFSCSSSPTSRVLSSASGVRRSTWKFKRNTRQEGGSTMTSLTKPESRSGRQQRCEQRRRGRGSSGTCFSEAVRTWAIVSFALLLAKASILIYCSENQLLYSHPSGAGLLQCTVRSCLRTRVILRKENMGHNLRGQTTTRACDGNFALLSVSSQGAAS